VTFLGLSNPSFQELSGLLSIVSVNDKVFSDSEATVAVGKEVSTIGLLQSNGK
jgi:hypothetical protein